MTAQRKTRRPTGMPSWPILLIAGSEKRRGVPPRSATYRLTTPAEDLVMPRRFFDKVDFQPEPDGCWLWAGANSGKERPYGVSWDDGRRVKAHRWAFLAAGGVLPEGYEPDHTCKTPLCVRPSHMEAVTQRENIMRSNAPGPLAVRTNRCKRGHEFTPENTRMRKDGGRTCRECERMRNRAGKARARQDAAATRRFMSMEEAA